MKIRTSPIRRKPTIVFYWWLPVAFLGPFIVAFNPAWHIDLLTTLFHAFRSGLVGLFVACVLYVLWKIDCRINRNFKPDRNTDMIIFMLGTLLWLVWFSTCQMILVARDEVGSADVAQSMRP